MVAQEEAAGEAAEEAAEEEVAQEDEEGAVAVVATAVQEQGARTARREYGNELDHAQSSR